MIEWIPVVFGALALIAAAMIRVAPHYFPNAVRGAGVIRRISNKSLLEDLSGAWEGAYVQNAGRKDRLVVPAVIHWSRVRGRLEGEMQLQSSLKSRDVLRCVACLVDPGVVLVEVANTARSRKQNGVCLLEPLNANEELRGALCGYGEFSESVVRGELTLKKMKPKSLAK